MTQNSERLAAKEKEMRLPIRNKTERTLHVFIEPWCDNYELPPKGEAFVHLEDGHPHSIDVFDGQVSIWSEGAKEVRVDVVSEEDQSIAQALQFARVWLYQLGGRDAADAMDEAIARLEGSQGYLKARACIFDAFHQGFHAKEAEQKPRRAALPPWPGDDLLAAAWAAGGTAAWLNRRARRRFAFPGWGVGPLDTDYAREVFAKATAQIGGTEQVDIGSVPAR